MLGSQCFTSANKPNTNDQPKLLGELDAQLREPDILQPIENTTFH